MTGNGTTEDLNSGGRGTFKVEMFDKWNNRLDIGGTPPTVIVSVGENEMDADVDDNKDGSYDVSYSVAYSGSYQISVTYNGEHLPGSPFSINVI